MQTSYTMESKIPHRGETLSYRAKRGIRRFLSLFTNLVASYPEPIAVSSLLSMSWAAQGVYAVTQLGIPGLLESGPRTVEELAEATRSDKLRLTQLMRALAGFGFFASDGAGRYCLTPTSRPLVGNSASNLYVRLWGEQLLPAGGRMLDMVQSGNVAFNLAHGQSAYDYYKQNAEAGKLFVEYMNSVTDSQRHTLVESYDFSPYRHIIDIGGGRASLLTTVLQAYPACRGTILDQPHMAQPIQERIRASNVADRCTFVGGSFFESVPAGGDLYLIKSVLHDWNDYAAITILRNVTTQMRSDSRLIIIEGLMDDRDDVAKFLKVRDLEQMVWCGGRVRTRAEFDELLAHAGLVIVSTRQSSIADGCLITARKK